MNKPILIDLFVEDRAHEEWIRPLLERIAKEENRMVHIRVRSAKGGHGRVVNELRIYQDSLSKKLGGGLPDLLVVAIDANCASFAEAQKTIDRALQPPFDSRALKATPDPHIERWFLADLETFHRVVGITPTLEIRKCERGYYKGILSQAIRAAGYPPTLKGIEFARELVESLDYFRAGKADTSFKHFLEDVRARLKQLEG